jgi:hypothetical protein
MGRLVAELNKAHLNPDGWLFAFADINFLHFAAILFALCSVVLVVAAWSRATPGRPGPQVEPLTDFRLEHGPARCWPAVAVIWRDPAE